MLAQLSLDEICNLIPNRPVRILKLWFGPGEPPLDRREEIYKQYEEEGKIQTLEVVGPTDWNDVIGSVANSISAMLPKYPVGTVDAVWASWDELAKGVYKACDEAGRGRSDLGRHRRFQPGFELYARRRQHLESHSGS